jgi:DNA modification methylase
VPAVTDSTPAPTPYYADEQVTLLLGDCLPTLPTLPDASVDAIVCDPPYGLEFMGKDWDAPWKTGNGFRRAANDADVGRDDPIGRTSRTSPEYIAGIGFQQWCQAWAEQCLRVLKPGGHMLAFGGTRTYHRLTCAIEDAGFEIRDSIACWLYGSGFPKSLNLVDEGGGRTGWGTALKPAFEPIVVARKPLAGTVAANVLAFGTGALNIDGCRGELTGESRKRSGEASQQRRYASDGGTNFAALPGMRGGDPAGRWPTNVVLTHAALLNADGDVIGDACAGGCVPGCPVAELDQQSGVGRTSKPGSRSAGGQHGTYSPIGAQAGSAMPYYGDTGGASRFFPVFRYEAKAPTSERPRLADGTTHPTVKPLALCQWLVRLVTPPGGLLLDPFAGSGATLAAAVAEGMRAIGVEQHQPYADLAVARLSKPIALGLFGEEAS